MPRPRPSTWLDPRVLNIGTSIALPNADNSDTVPIMESLNSPRPARLLRRVLKRQEKP